MNAQASRRIIEESPPGMSKALVFSLIFHATVVLICIFGLPYIKKDLDEVQPPVPIELVEISDKTQTDKPVERAQIKPVEEEKEPPKPQPERPKQAPKQTSETPPRPVAPPVDELALPDKVKEPEKKIEKPKEKPPTPKRRPTPVPPKEEVKPQEDPFQSLLKNLQDAKPEPAKDAGTAESAPKAAPAPLGDRMTMSEMDALRQQLAQCWNVLAGARYAEDLVVDMKLFMNPDRTVREAGVVDVIRYNTDTIFRAAADSALRAVRNPACNPLRLPPDKYNQWKEITVRFDPREIL
jgi:outer membrane biosynthesis protein TonB